MVYVKYFKFISYTCSEQFERVAHPLDTGMPSRGIECKTENKINIPSHAKVRLVGTGGGEGGEKSSFSVMAPGL